ncbi:MAG TPA: class I SAM-dependent methyltransferase [Vicinamibacterales bacterium]|nr:class I SAM-dependent methyltransferase [Vicinamibacterales bacterium]
MSVARHLGIQLSEYDARIRTFIPDYEEMIAVAGEAMPADAHTILDLGVGTGALSAACLAHARRAHAIGIDADAEILALAARRLGSRATLVAGSFTIKALPRCDVAVASFSLHHIRTRPAKRSLYRRLHAALRRGGMMITVDCQPAADSRVRRTQFDRWLAHLRRAYSPAVARGLLRAWSHEDVYVPLDAEIGLLRESRFRVEVLWRRGAFAVLRATR